MSVNPRLAGIAPVLPGETAAEYSDRLFGAPTKIVESVVSVLTTPTPLLPGNPRRLFWLAVNNAPNAGALAFNQQLTTITGVVMGPNGGFTSMEVFEDGLGVTWAVFAIQSVAAGNWYVMEVMRT